MTLIPRYQTGSADANGFPLQRVTNRFEVVAYYRTRIASDEVALILNKWAGQELTERLALLLPNVPDRTVHCAPCNAHAYGELADLLGHDPMGHRTYNALRRSKHQVRTIAALVELNEYELIDIHNLGDKGLARVHESIHHYRTTQGSAAR